MKLRAAANGFRWWCPACEMVHPLPSDWKFDGNFDAPTFKPSFKHSWGDERVCHYVITKGKVEYCSDCTHAMAGKTIEMPEMKEES